MFIYEMSVEECRELLARIRIGRLACARDNQPYVVPFHFACDDREHLYSSTANLYAFSMPGQKIEWMRANPLVCVEVDEIKRQDDWASIIIFGRYEELPDAPEFEAERKYAHEMFSRHAMWWQPAAVSLAHKQEAQNDHPIYFRIQVEKMSGHRAVGDAPEEPLIPDITFPVSSPHWWNHLWTHGRSKRHKEQ